MSDETPKSEDDAKELPLGGERLRAARRAHDISVRDVAKELHLDEVKVRALERNEFDVLGAPVFAKGHLRKYAELVGVPIDDVMTDYYQMTRASVVPPIIGPKRPQTRDINLGPWLGAGIMLIILAAAAFWWFALRTPATETRADISGPVPTATRPAQAEPVVVDPEPQATPESAADESDFAAAAGTAETDAVERAPTVTSYEPTPGTPQVAMELAFSGDCWTEVTDAAGRKLFYDLGRDGRVVAVTGDAPLRVILGDANNVDITVDGEEWPIPASARRGRLARLTITRR